VLLLPVLEFVQSLDDLLVLPSTELQCLVQVSLGLVHFANVHVGFASSEECLLVFVFLIQHLGRVLDDVVVLFEPQVAMTEVKANRNLDLPDEANCCLGVSDDVVLALEEHLHGEEGLVVVLHSFFKLFSVYLNSAISLFNIGHPQFLVI